MTGTFLVVWAGLGAVGGGVLGMTARHLLVSAWPLPVPIEVLASLLTTGVFDGLAAQLGPQWDLLPYSVLGAFGVALSLIDVIEQRLPAVLIYVATACVGMSLLTSAAVHSRGGDLARSLCAMVLVAALYLLLAVASRGGLGSGDVKLGGLLGLGLGWSSWATVFAATFLAWLAAVLAWFLLRVIGRTTPTSSLPMGPFLVGGALLAIGLLAD